MGNISVERRNNFKNCCVNLLIIAFFTALGLAFSVLCSNNLTTGIFLKYKFWISLLLYAGTAVLTVMAIVFYFLKFAPWHKLTVTLYILWIFVLILAYCLLISGFFDVIQSEEKFEEYLQSTGSLMPVLFIVLQYLQVVVLPIPSYITLAGGTMLFGAVNCFFYSYFAIVLGSLTGYFIARWLGFKVVAWMIGEDTLNKWLKKIKGKDYFLITAMFLLPYFPDDVLCFVAGLTNITPTYFIIMVILCRAFTCAATCFPLELVKLNGLWGLAILGVTFILATLSFFIFCKYQDKIVAIYRKIKARWFKKC